MSTKTKHTPLPWHESEMGDFGSVNIQESTGKPIAFLGVHLRTQVENEQNTAFIVRACNAHDDLVAVLAQIASYPERHNMTDGGDRAHQEMAQLAANALAKAGAKRIMRTTPSRLMLSGSVLNITHNFTPKRKASYDRTNPTRR